MENGKILQLKISLVGSSPMIWRRFLVEDNISFEDLHNIIQDIMGWDNYHLWEFKVENKRIAPSDENDFNPAEGMLDQLSRSPEFKKMLESEDLSKKGGASLDIAKVNEILSNVNKKSREKGENSDIKILINELINGEGQTFTYRYDFGDNWRHKIIVEKIIERVGDKEYPYCADGKMASPPEDCGGMCEYMELLKIRKDKKHPDYEERIVEWLGEDFDPEEFNINKINESLNGCGDEDDFIPLTKLLLEDNEKAKSIKTIYQREVEYVEFLGPIEAFFAHYYYYGYPQLRDIDIIKAIKNVRDNYDKDISFFKTDLEKELIDAISSALQNASRKVTKHELFLVFGYILWCIDNRKHLGDPRAYLNWICNFFHLFKGEDKKKFMAQYQKYAQDKGLDKEQLKNLVSGDGDYEFDANDIALNNLDSQKFTEYGKVGRNDSCPCGSGKKYKKCCIDKMS